MKLRILEVLEEKGKTKNWLFKQLKLGEKCFYNLINNLNATIKYEMIEKLCKLLDCTPNDLFDYTKSKNECTNLEFSDDENFIYLTEDIKYLDTLEDIMFKNTCALVVTSKKIIYFLPNPQQESNKIHIIPLKDILIENGEPCIKIINGEITFAYEMIEITHTKGKTAFCSYTTSFKSRSLFAILKRAFKDFIQA